MGTSTGTCSCSSLVLGFCCSAKPSEPKNGCCQHTIHSLLRWDWSHKQRNITFTTEYGFSNEGSYTGRCTGGTQRWCNLSAQLDYTGSYALRVRAERWGSRSNWTRLRFCPDEQASLGLPSHVRVEPGNAMVTISFREPMTEEGAPMSSILKPMAFRLQYWDAQTPSQKLLTQIRATEHTLVVQPWTRYCLQVSAYAQEYDKTSNYTEPRCATTTGDMWPVLLAVVCVALLTGAVYAYYSKNKSVTPGYTIPDSILTALVIHAPLVEPQEDSCVVTALMEQVARGSAGVVEASDAMYAPLRCSGDRSSRDSGIYSGEDSGRSSDQ